jgi:AraC-like DNA-binding protein
MHAERSYILMYLQGGEGMLRMTDRDLELGAGDLVVLSPGELHDAQQLARTRGVIVTFSASALNPAYSDSDLVFPSALPSELRAVALFRFASTHLPPVRIAQADRGEWDARLRRMARELDDRAIGFAEAVRAELCLMLIAYSRLAAERVEARMPGAICPLLHRVFDYIDANYKRPIALADVAKAVKLSRAYLTNTVRKETGRTVGDWIAERRMAEARRLLHVTDLSVAQVARVVSYTDAGYFTRLFKRLHGVTPVTWRTSAH